MDRLGRAEVLDLRAGLVEEGASPATVNRIVALARTLIEEWSRQEGIEPPDLALRRLRLPRTGPQPFALPEIELIFKAVPAIYREYTLIRFFTGLRAGEIAGLSWGDVDLEGGRLCIRRTWSNGAFTGTKTPTSVRDVCFGRPVRESLERQWRETGGKDFVFLDDRERPVDASTYAREAWYPALQSVGLPRRAPRQTRHTFASLALSAGESAGWVARQLGHADTATLHRVYSGYVPVPGRTGHRLFQMLESTTELMDRRVGGIP